MTRLAWIMLAGCAVALAGCSSRGNTVFEQMAPLLQDQFLGGGEEVAAPARQPTRAELNEIPYATISLQVGDLPPTYVVPATNNGGFLVYQDRGRRGIVMEGGLITATHGLGYDLDAVAHSREDPIARPTPVSEWPATVSRSYSFSIRGQQQYDIGVLCAYERGAREFIEIVELRFEVIRVVETCRNPARSFVNTYWANADTGFIWKSQQWVGPRLDPMTVEIVRPYGRS